MSQGEAAGRAAQRAGAAGARVVRAFRVLRQEERLAAYASIGLFLSLFLPWYQETVIAPTKATRLASASATITGWGAFSFVEAAVLLVAVGVLTLLIQRAEGRAFHLPGGDGWVITAAGLWTCALVIWRIFDKQGTTIHGAGASTSGIEWGIFVALGVAAFLAYAGSRIRLAHRTEPPLPGETEPPSQPPVPNDSPGEEQPVRRQRAAGDEQPLRPPRPVREEQPIRPPRPVRAEDPPTMPMGGEDAATRPMRAPSAPAAQGHEELESDDQLTMPFDSGGSER